MVAGTIREASMTAKILTGTKQEIAAAVAGIAGEVREAIVFVEDGASPQPAHATREDIFAEMEPYTVRVGTADYGRDSIYGDRDPE
jgi:hypothetical protein